jgi:GTP-binding protein
VTSHRFDSARFATSVAELEQLNAAALAMVPEVAFVGRSNAGKSSAINALTRRRRLAFSSKTPGRTQLLNFFALTTHDASGEERTCGYLVDLPGYGFAKVDDATRARWDQLVGRYLQTRRMLRGVVLVMDARHPVRSADEELLAWLASREDATMLRVHILLNKADQLGNADRRSTLARVEQRAEALPMPTSVQLFSALKHEGIDELRAAMDEMLSAKLARDREAPAYHKKSPGPHRG